MKSSLTLKSRLFFSIAAILAVSYTILFILSGVILQRFIDDQTEKDLQYSLKYAKNQFNARQELTLELLKLAAVTPQLQNGLQSANSTVIRNSVSLLTESLEFLEVLTIVDVHQNVTARINGRDSRDSFFRGELLKTVYERKQPIVTTEIIPYDRYCIEVKFDVCQALVENKDVMVQLVFMPVKSTTGEIVGAIVAGDDINKDPHLPYQQQKVFGKTVEMLITQMGEQVASTMNESREFGSMLEKRVLQSLKNGYSFNGITDFNGRKYEMLAEPIYNHRGEFIGSIAVALRLDRFISFSNGNFVSLSICGLFSMVLIFILSFIASRRFTAPIKGIVNAALSIKEGNYSFKTPDQKTVEFTLLGNTLNLLAGVLQQKASMITALTSEVTVLHKEVAASEATNGELETEAALGRFIVNVSLDGIVVVGSDGMIITVNPAVEKLLCSTSTELVGAPFSHLCDLAGGKELEAAISAGISGNLAGKETSLAVLCNNRNIRVRITALTAGDINGHRVLLDIRDITTDGDLDRLKNGFIAKVSHELKTPLTSMKGSLQFILKKGKWLTVAEREMLLVCLRNTDRLTDLVGGIIELSRIEAGQISIALRPLQIGEVVLYAIEETKGGALIKNISVVNDVPMDLPKVNGDYGRLTQVLSNLLSNAVKFSPENTVVTISAFVAKSSLSISVSDDGKVIPEEKRSALFSTFQQMGNPEDGEFCGSGLGLAICREIMDIHRGSIYYTPGGAKGNIFTITVPLYGESDDSR